MSFTRVSLLDPVSYMGNITPEMLTEYVSYVFAKKIGMFTRVTREKGFIVRGVRIIDLDGLGMSHLSNEMLKYLQNVVGPAQKNFPEHMYKVFIINAPSIFSVGWAVIKSFLPERSIKKIAIMGANYKDTLLQYIPADQLPSCYGGNNPNPVWIDNEAKYTKTKIPARDSIKIEKAVWKSSRVLWNFRTIYADIGFKVQFVSSREKKTVDIVPQSRVESFKKIIKGEYFPKESGTIMVVFDNSYSMWTAKDIIYFVDVTEVNLAEESKISN